jgi:predicted DCC family thiol-disulfide oxidoreductase YuxK
MNKSIESHYGIVVFDGICNICNALVNFIIVRDDKNTFKFAPMQSNIGQQILSEHHMSSENIDTFLLVKNDKVLIKSDAALAIARELKVPWNYLVILKYIPKPIRDYCYFLIASNRYKWFGRKEHCMLPTPELQDKFLT